ncbi:MAG: glycine cleavage system protein H [Terriglobia bacterium]
MVAIFVVLMFLGFILADLALQKWEARRAAPGLVPARGADSAGREAPHPAIRRDWPPLPEAVYLSENHNWLRPRPQGAFHVGVDALVGQAVGAVSRVIPPRVGSEVWAGAPLFRIAAGDRTLTVPAPVTGRVVKVNGDLQDRPELVFQAPYTEGWVCEFLPSRLAEEKPAWRLGEKAVTWFEQEVRRFSDFLWQRFDSDFALGETSLDGGIPAAGSLRSFDADVWQAFEAEFLRPR